MVFGRKGVNVELHLHLRKCILTKVDFKTSKTLNNAEYYE